MIRRAGVVLAVGCLTLLAVGCLTLLAVGSLTLLAERAVAAQAKTFGGIVPDQPTDAPLPGEPLAHAANVPYGGGEVLHSNRTHVIFWQPAGSGLTFDPGYESLIETFLGHVAAASHSTDTVYGLSGQYTDAQGPAVYDSTYGGAVVATDPLPGNGCTEPLTNPGWTTCLSDTQLEFELQHVVGLDHLPSTGDDVYFLVLPDGLGDCESSGPDFCALGGATAGSFCGYHSSTPDGSILYAVIPYNAIAGHCNSADPRPNSDAADPALSTISHEQMEMITDPNGDAWIDGAGNEVGDLCLGYFGPTLGGAGAGAWDEVIDGGHYYLQEEWSNRASSCQPRAQPDSLSFAAPIRAAPHRPVAFHGRARDPDGTIVSYDWFFGDGRSARGRRVWHAFSRLGSYRVVLRTTDSWGNWAFYDRVVTVASGLLGNRRRSTPAAA